MSPRKSLKRLVFFRKSAKRAKKLLKLWSYETKIFHALKKPNLVARINFCKWFLRSIHDGEADPQLVFLPQ
jgi:hypothetical protein